MITAPDMVAVALLAADEDIATLTGGRISTDLQPGGPAIRLTLLPGATANPDWEWVGVLDCECWADDQADAADLAAAVRAAWPDHTGRALPQLTAWVSGTWITRDPTWLPDPDDASPRYVLGLGVAVHELVDQ